MPVKHQHDFKLSYTIKDKTGTKAMYYCKECGDFRESEELPKQKRASNMGGEFSTNWRP